MEYSSKRIGNLTEICCMKSFMSLGYNISIPFGDCERYDFIVDYKGKLLKIQCKTARPSKDNTAIKVNGRSNVRKKGKTLHRRYTNKEVDYIATYYNNICYIIPVEEMGSDKLLRFSIPKNHQMERINFAKDFELEKVLNRIN